jgi:CRP-like cAMP-binding protein
MNYTQKDKMTVAQTFLKDFVNGIIPFKPNEFKQLYSIFEEKVYAKGSFPIEIGTVSDQIILITKGILREFTIIDNEEHTYWISTIGETVAAPESFLNQSPSTVSVEAITITHALVTKKADFDQLLLKLPKLSLLMNVVFQKTISEFQQHLLLLKVVPTLKREELLYNLKPYLFRKEIKVKHLASLLNVHPNSLSRIHKNRLRMQNSVEDLE